MVKKSKANVLVTPFQGRWRIAELELWDNDALDLVEPAFISISGQEGEMRFIAVRAWLDIRYTSHDGGPRAEFSWEGVDEGDQRSGCSATNRLRNPASIRMRTREVDLVGGA
ncbi:MAG: hypothetical protein R6U98_15980 [Pirellulaceae bacterium]